jgi:hypothetical protein
MMSVAGQKVAEIPYKQSDAQLEVLAGMTVVYLLRTRWQVPRWARKSARKELFDFGYVADLDDGFVGNYVPKLIRVADKAAELTADRFIVEASAATDEKAALKAMLGFFASRNIRKPYHLALWASSSDYGPLNHEREKSGRLGQEGRP